MIGRADVDAAWRRLEGRIRHTPVLRLERGELGVDAHLVLKLEQLQHTGSFKPRGVYNRVLSGEVPEAGIVAASGGNHGAAVAFAAQGLGIPAEVFVPESTPTTKVERILGYGARVAQLGHDYAEAEAASRERAAETGALVVHAHDQAEVVAGQGTVGRELQEQAPGVDTVMVAVGGGGLIGGIAAWYGDDVEVVGVEPERCPTLREALRAGTPVEVEVGGLAADSLGARRVGEIALSVARQHVDDCLLVADAAIETARQELWSSLRLAVEPGGAAAMAALMSGAYRPRADELVGVVLCGANADPATLGRLGRNDERDSRLK